MKWLGPGIGIDEALTGGSAPQSPPDQPVLRGRGATIVAAALGVDVAGVAVAGYNETMAGAGVRRVPG